MTGFSRGCGPLRCSEVHVMSRASSFSKRGRLKIRKAGVTIVVPPDHTRRASTLTLQRLSTYYLSVFPVSQSNSRVLSCPRIHPLYHAQTY